MWHGGSLKFNVDEMLADFSTKKTFAGQIISKFGKRGFADFG
jgi:hypothetical protein